MAIRTLATCTREFWAAFAPWADPTSLFEKYPPESGGLSFYGWRTAVKRERRNHPDLDWPDSRRGVRALIPTDKPWPEPVYLDEVATISAAPPQERPAAARNADEPAPYKETLEILPDGSRRSDKLILMSEAQEKDEAFMLDAHGFDAVVWEVVSAKSHRWHVYSKNAEGNGHDISTLYASKLTVRKRVVAFDTAAVMAALEKARPLRVEVTASPDIPAGGLLEVSPVDMHFGPSTLAHYRPTLDRIVARIRSRRWDKIVLPIGNDLCHNDNLEGTTVKGTAVDKMDVPTVVSEVAVFYGTILEEALETGAEVSALYTKANHDASMSWMICFYLSGRYPQVTFDLDIRERKVFSYGDVCIGFTHGDKSVKDFDRVFMADFPEFANAKVREIHSAHRHHEIVKDNNGIVSRTLPTAAVTDTWHDSEGYVGAAKRFQLFEYTRDALTAIHYV